VRDRPCAVRTRVAGVACARRRQPWSAEPAAQDPAIRDPDLPGAAARVRLRGKAAVPGATRFPCMRRLIAIAFCVPLVCAAQQVASTGDYLSRMDGDQDGKISLLEYQDWLSYAFDAMDANRDGQLDAQEQPASGRGARAALSREQHRLTLAERFGKQDRNRDGWLDARELASPPQ